MLLTSTSPGAIAQSGGTYQRTTPKLEIEVTQTERTKKVADKALQSKAKKAPAITADEFLKVQGSIGEIRKSQRRSLQTLIERTDDADPAKPGLMFRLAESFAQEQRYHRFRKFEALEVQRTPKSATTSNQAALAKAKRDFSKHRAAERVALTRAVETYSAMARNKRFRNYEKGHEVLFYYAYTLREAGEDELSRAVFKQLLKRYPTSQFAPNALLSFADHFFDTDDLETAMRFYRKVLEFPRSSLYDYAHYKIGWIYLNQDRNTEALTMFFELAQNTEGKPKKRVLHVAATKDFVRAYAEIGKATRAYQAFQRVDKNRAAEMLGTLAFLYSDQGRAKKSIYTFRELIKLRPEGAQVCEWQYQIQQAVLSVGDKEEIVRETVRLSRLARKISKKKLLKASRLRECRQNASAVTAELAKLWHVEVNSTFNLEALDQVARLYTTYLSHYPSANDHGTMQFHYADLLWLRAEKTESAGLAAQRWEDAAVEFSKVASSKMVGKLFKKEAAYASALGWKNALNVDPQTQAPPPPKEFDSRLRVPKPRPIERRQQKMIEAFTRYTQYLDKNDGELVMMKFLIAKTYSRHDHLETSFPMFLNIVENHPKHETARYSANILLNNLVRLGKIEQLVDVANKMLGNKMLLQGKAELRERLVAIKITAMRIAATKLEKQKKWIACGQAYIEIYETNPNASGMDEVLYNAGVCFENGKSIGFAITMFRQLREDFPKSPQAQKALVRMGNAFGAIARYEEAAALFEEYAKKYGGAPLASSALSQAVTYRKGIGDDAQAIANTEFYVRQYRNKQRQQTAEALFSMTAIYEKQGRSEKVVSHLKRYLREYGSKGGIGRVVIANARIGELLWRRSCKVVGVDGACVKIVREKVLRRKMHRRHRSAFAKQMPKRCGETDRIVLTTIRRDRRRASEAQVYLRRAVQEWRKAKHEIEADLAADAANWAMAAQFYLADAHYEAFLGIEFPENLDFNPEKPRAITQSRKRFAKWFELKMRALSETNKLYLAIRNGKSAAWAIAAAARMGQIPQNFADGLYRAEVPAVARTGPFAEDLYYAYCGELEDFAKPAEKRSIDAFTFCLAETTKRNWFNRWARLCERELGTISREDFPPADERLGAVDKVAPITESSPILIELNR